MYVSARSVSEPWVWQSLSRVWVSLESTEYMIEEGGLHWRGNAFRNLLDFRPLLDVVEIPAQLHTSVGRG